MCLQSFEYVFAQPKQMNAITISFLPKAQTFFGRNNGQFVSKYLAAAAARCS